MGKSLSNTLTQILASFGCLVALVLTYEHYHQSTDIGCSKFGGDCSKTIESIYGHVGPIPTSLFGLGMYLLFIILCRMRRNKLQAYRVEEAARAVAYETSAADTAEVSVSDLPTEELGSASREQHPTPPTLSRPALSTTDTPAQIKHLDMDIWILALFGFCISWWLQYKSIFTLHTFCPWCFSSAILVTLIFGLASRDYLLDGRQLTGEQRMLAGTLGFIAVLLAVVYYPELIKQLHTDPIVVDTAPPVTRADLVTPDMHTKGDPKAPYLIVEFADYQCSHCKDAYPVMENLLKKNPKRFRLGFRNYPLGKFAWSNMAALSAEAAGEQGQGKFWQMHDSIFDHQSEMEQMGFDSSRFDEYAKELGLDVERFKRDKTSDKIESRLAADKQEGDRAHLNMTPSFFFVPTDPNKKIIRFSGKDALLNALNDPNNAIWK
jgi:protein-disulfide isomerase